MLAALGRIDEFELHFRGGLRNGCTLGELRETLVQVTVYAGVPRGRVGVQGGGQGAGRGGRRYLRLTGWPRLRGAGRLWHGLWSDVWEMGTMADAQINGARIWYDVHGEGEDYLLQIGGAGFAHENFGFVTDKMTPHFKVIEFDLRGYGLSERPEQEYSMELWADDIKGLLDAIGVERTHVHGTSMAAWSRSLRGPLPRARRRPRARLRLGQVRLHGPRPLGGLEAARAGLRHGREPLALEIATKCLSRRFLDTPAGPETVKVIQGVLERNCVGAGLRAARATRWRPWICGPMRQDDGADARHDR